MFLGKRIWIACAALAACALSASAAERYDMQPRTVPVWRGEPSSVTSPTRLAQNRLAIPSLPSEDDDEEDVATPSASIQNSIGNDDSMDWGGGYGGGCNDGGCDSGCCLPFWAHRTYFFGEYLYLRPTGNNVAHAISQNGVGGPGTTPNGRVGVVDSNYQGGFRIGAAKAIDYCSSIEVSYANFQTHAFDQLISGPNLGDTLASLVLHPASTNAGSTSSLIDASHDVDFRTVDLSYRRLLSGGFRHAVNYNIGARYGKLKQDFEQIGNFSQPNGTIQTNTTVTFEGGGLRTGLDGARQLGCGGLSAYGKGFINVLFGQVNSLYTQVDNTTTIVQATSNWRDERVVPVLEYELGINWVSRNGRWSSSTGYYTAFWFNSVTTSQYIQGVQTANFVDLGETVTFDGFVSRLEYRF